MTAHDGAARGAGRELDAEVAERVMGWKRVPGVYKPSWQAPDSDLYTSTNGLPVYSAHIVDAWAVVEKMRADGFNFHLHAFTPVGYGGEFQVDFVCCCGPCPKHGHTEHSAHGAFEIRAATVPLAICLAALATGRASQ